MTTLSQLVDEVVRETLRPDMIEQITTFINLTIRELHADPKTGLSIGFVENLVETQLTSTQDSGYVFEIPDPALFQFVEAIWFRRGARLAVERKPSSMHAYMSTSLLPAAYYRSGPTIVFDGYGGSGQLIDLAYCAYPRGLKYYTPALRPVTWDDENRVWNYHADFNVNDAQRLIARTRCTNWLMARHKELVKQGTIAKLYARRNDQERARLAYSLYEQLRPGFVSAESYERGTLYRN